MMENLEGFILCKSILCMNDFPTFDKYKKIHQNTYNVMVSFI